MASTNAGRQLAWRERHRGEPQGNKVLMAQFAARRTTGGPGSGGSRALARAAGWLQGAARVTAGGVSDDAGGARRTDRAVAADRGL